jgi:acetyltransferase-like isoleucine patch superfamily enzyme
MAGINNKSSLLKLFFKAGYVIRKKIEGYKIRYQDNEYRYLFSDRVCLPLNYYFTQFPVLEFDTSESKLVMQDSISCRGPVRFVFFENGIIEVGQGTFFNANCAINALLSIKIGENCLFGENVKVYDHNHNFKATPQLIKEQGYSKAPVQIGSNCWIGSNVTILKGVTIGNNCVIGANSLVNKDLPSDSILINPVHSKVSLVMGQGE